MDPHWTDLTGNTSVDYIQDNRQTPFFLMMSFSAIHDPLIERADSIRMWRENPLSEKPENNPIIAAILSRLDRNLGMVSVEGVELSAPHHMVSLFNSLTSGGPTEAETQQKITELGGIVYFAHPGRYVDRWGLTAHWYVDMYLRFDVLIVQAVFNRVDNHQGDREFFDKIVHILGHERPVWLFSEDDMHRETTLGWNRDVILIENFRPGSLRPEIQDGSARDVYLALRNGHSWLWKPSEQYIKRAFNITNVTFTDNRVTLTIDDQGNVKEIRWVTHNPNTGISETVHYGNSISESNVPAWGKFVRAEIEGGEGTIYTQSFYLK